MTARLSRSTVSKRTRIAVFAAAVRARLRRRVTRVPRSSHFLGAGKTSHLTMRDKAGNEARCCRYPRRFDYKHFLTTFLWMIRREWDRSAPSKRQGVEGLIACGVHREMVDLLNWGSLLPVQSIQDEYRDKQVPVNHEHAIANESH